MMNSCRALLVILLLCRGHVACAQKLQASFDQRGVLTLNYGGVSLIDLNAGRGAAFSVGSYQLGDKSGWGETGKAESWDNTKHILTWAWDWGSIHCQFKTMSN